MRVPSNLRFASTELDEARLCRWRTCRANEWLPAPRAGSAGGGRMFAGDCLARSMARVASVLLAAQTATTANPLEQSYAPYGHLIVTPFVTAPFPHPARAEGHQYKDRHYPAKDHYSDSAVAIFIPNGFRETGEVDFVVHFHGWNNTVAGTLQTFKLIEQLVGSGRNAVLVVPEGPHNAPDSFGGKLEDANGFKRFMDEVVATLRQRASLKQSNFAVGRIILSGHSGGYRVMSAILDRGGLSDRVKEVWLFDALYAEGDKFLAWWHQERGRLLNIYTHRGGTKDDSEVMMELLKSRGLPFLAAEEARVTRAELGNAKLAFLHTNLGHNEVLEKRQTFGLFLSTSCLAEITPGDAKTGQR